MLSEYDVKAADAGHFGHGTYRGGFGPPRYRPLPLLAADIRGGMVSRASAERDYGADLVRQALGEDATAPCTPDACPTPLRRKSV
jgi:N-methylhydantoinase B/oxoprolinase/acetone carboxylase alpha subunit